MEEKFRGLSQRAGMLIFCGSILAVPVLASPPPVKAAHAGTGVAHLDLRPPVERAFAVYPAPRAASQAEPAFKSLEALAGRRAGQSSGRPGDAEKDGNYLPGLGLGSSQSRSVSQAEAFARRFHREGLPVARLWENHSALLSLGLNQKGKPGLWVVQKTH